MILVTVPMDLSDAFGRSLKRVKVHELEMQGRAIHVSASVTLGEASADCMDFLSPFIGFFFFFYTRQS